MEYRGMGLFQQVQQMPPSDEKARPSIQALTQVSQLLVLNR